METTFSHRPAPQTAPPAGSTQVAFTAPEPCPAPRDPDCVQGKHRACSGTAWDEDADQLTGCACPCHDEGEDQEL